MRSLRRVPQQMMITVTTMHNVPSLDTPGPTHLLAKIRAKKAAIDRAERPRVHDFFRSPIVRWLLLAMTTVLAAATAMLSYFIRPQQDYIIVRYSAFFGVSPDMVGPWWHAYGHIVYGAAVLVGNTLLALWAYRLRERIAAYVMLFGALFVQMAVLVGVIAIVIVNR